MIKEVASRCSVVHNDNLGKGIPSDDWAVPLADFSGRARVSAHPSLLGTVGLLGLDIALPTVSLLPAAAHPLEMLLNRVWER